MVGAGDRHRHGEAGQAQFGQPRLVHRQRLHAVAHHHRRDLGCAVQLHRGARRLRRPHRRRHAAVIQHGAEVRAVARRLACVLHILAQVGVDREVVADAVKRHRLVAVGAVAGRQGVALRRRPPHADEAVHGIADRGGLLDRDLVHHAPAPHRDEVGLVAADLQPRRLLLLTGMVNRQQLQREAVLFGQLLQRADRLLAVGRVVIDQRDLLALQAAALDVEHVLDDDRGRVPVGAGIVEHPGKNRAVGRRGAPVAHGVQRDLVLRRLGDQLIGDAGGQRLEHQHALALEALVALDALLGVVGGLAGEIADRLTLDAAVTLLQQGEIVGVAVGERDAVRRVGAGAIVQPREHDLGEGRAAERGGGEGGEQRFLHRFLSPEGALCGRVG